MSTVAAFCIAMAVYHEANIDTVSGQIKVGYVIMHAVEWNDEMVCSKVFERHYITSLNSVKKVPNDSNLQWQTAQAVAYYVLNVRQKGDTVNGSNHFYGHTVDGKPFMPHWGKRCKIQATSKYHNFCRIDKHKVT